MRRYGVAGGGWRKRRIEEDKGGWRRGRMEKEKNEGGKGWSWRMLE